MPENDHNQPDPPQDERPDAQSDASQNPPPLPSSGQPAPEKVTQPQAEPGQPALPPQPTAPSAPTELEVVDDLDAASQSLADAMRVSFTILAIVMFVLVILFLFSGSFSVQENQVAVRVLFGQIVENEDGQKVVAPGGPYLFPPAPIGEVIYVPTTLQQVDVGDTYWMFVNPDDRLKSIEELSVPRGGLMPGRDGSLLTADQNIVHGRFVINYRIARQDAAIFVQNVGDLDRAAELVKAAAKSAIVRVAATTRAEDYYLGQVSRDDMEVITQQILRDEMNSGISIDSITMPEKTVPLAVRNAFESVTQAVAEKQQAIDQAITERAKILNSAAGPAHPALLLVIDLYEQARARKSPDVEAAAEAALNRLLDGATVTTAVRPLVNLNPDATRWADWDDWRDQFTDMTTGPLASAGIGDQASRVIEEARSFSASFSESIKGQKRLFDALNDEYKRNPDLVINRLWNDTREQILATVLEKWYLPSDPSKTLYLELAPDPEIIRDRERDRFRQLQEAER